MLLDQGVSSASNFLFLLVIARSASTSALGAFVLAFSFFTFALTVSRSCLGIPLSTDLNKLSGDGEREFVGRTMAVALVFGAMIGVGILVFVAAFPMEDSLGKAMLTIAAFSPLLVAQDIGRYVNIGNGMPGRALVSDLIWLTAVLANWAWSLHTGTLSPGVGVVWWVSGGLLAGLYLVPSLRVPAFSGTWTWFRRDARRRHLVWDAVLGAGTPMVIVAMIAAIVSTVAVGDIRGAGILVTPMNVLVAAVVTGTVAEASRLSWSNARRLIMAVTAVLVAFSLAWAALLLALPRTIGVQLLGETWDSARTLLPVIIPEMVGVALWAGGIALMFTGGHTGIAVKIRVAYSVGAISLTAGSAVLVGTARSVQLSLSITALAVAVVSWIVALRLPPPDRSRDLSPDAALAGPPVTP